MRLLFDFLKTFDFRSMCSLLSQCIAQSRIRPVNLARTAAQVRLRRSMSLTAALFCSKPNQSLRSLSQFLHQMVVLLFVSHGVWWGFGIDAYNFLDNIYTQQGLSPSPPYQYIGI